MKIAVISSWFSEGMGYSENLFPRALAELGHDVHLVSSTAQVYFDQALYETTYAPHLGPRIVPPVTKRTEGYTLHRLPFRELRPPVLNPFTFSGIRIDGLGALLSRISPDVVQVVNQLDEPVTYDAAVWAEGARTPFFTESHLHISVVPSYRDNTWKRPIRPFVYGIHRWMRRINARTVLCYPIAADAAELAERMFHVPPEKIKVQPLGVDTGLFRPAAPDRGEERERLRASLGFEPSDLVCIYTGRFSAAKSPHVLAEAVELLQRRGEKVRGLFVGSGSPEEVERLRRRDGCVVHPFVPAQQLPSYYRAADIGVWPREESTSQLDAAACGLPLILSDRIHVKERVEGNGTLYSEGDAADLAAAVLRLAPAELRREYGRAGVEKVVNGYSWKAIAAERVKDYEQHR